MLHLPHLSFCTLYMFFVVFYDGNKLELELELELEPQFVLRNTSILNCKTCYIALKGILNSRNKLVLYLSIPFFHFLLSFSFCFSVLLSFYFSFLLSFFFFLSFLPSFSFLPFYLSFIN